MCIEAYHCEMCQLDLTYETTNPFYMSVRRLCFSSRSLKRRLQEGGRGLCVAYAIPPPPVPKASSHATELEQSWTHHEVSARRHVLHIPNMGLDCARE